MKIPKGFTLNDNGELMAFMEKLNATLKPCPFCGNKKPQAPWHGEYGAVSCFKCHAMGPRIAHKEDTEPENLRALVKALVKAAKAWNTAKAWNKRVLREE